MAAAILNSRRPHGESYGELEIESRGLVVLFPEPYNPKMVGVLKENGIDVLASEARQLEEEDFGSRTLILAMTENQKQRILEDYEQACNVYTIGEFAGEQEDIEDTLGGGKEEYAQAFINMAYFVNRVAENIWNTK